MPAWGLLNEWTWILNLNDLPPALIIACFALLGLGLTQLAKIQKEAIAYLRGVSREEAERIYHSDYRDGDGASFSWREMRDYCRATDAAPRFRLWITVVITAIGGGIGSIFLDQALRN